MFCYIIFHAIYFVKMIFHVTVFGAVTGGLLLGVINQGMSIIGLDNNWQYVVKDAILLFAVIFDVVSSRKAYN
ncbi:MAG: hypothetical protein K6E49_08060 [Lachnospiraceae bacterium]|nr:hypothetical protein [Lachnospiraceae bacterium]